MAAELVGGAFLSSFLGVLFDRLSSPEVASLIRGKKLDQKLLQRLETTLYVVQAVLNDAEQKQITNPAVKKWLANLEDAVYVADDLLDEISTIAATQKDPGTFWSRYFNLQDREMVSKIEEVIDTLESIAEHKGILGLVKIAEKNMSWRVPSTSLVEKSEIYGRDNDKEAIINLLLDDTCDAKVSVIPIVGMGGVGKTTLAQLVYNDDKLNGKFDYKAWVCVSDQFDIVRVTKTIIQAVTSRSCNEDDLNFLQNDLKEKLSRKKFLIVLDDMWNDHFDDWKILRKPFQYGNKGSKILVTTRSDKVAFVVQTIPAFKLSLLTDEDCWSVFVKHAFLSTESREYSTLEQIGRKIVEKCKGLPLAVETLGGLLRTTDYDIRDWDNILKSEIWKVSEDQSGIIPALTISYHYLPSHLKRCFVYCSLYPKDYEFDKRELILLWMAEDFLQPKGLKTLEEIGCEYFNELVARSFFQPSSANGDLFVMHDLMHDLAILYAGEFYFRGEEIGNTAEIGIKTRHLSHNARGNYPISKLLSAFDRVKHTRTFLEINLNRKDPFNMENAPCIFLSQLKYLRVLSFNSFPLYSLPDSIGELIHLRYLDLSHTRIVTLPESLSKLYNLQTLKLKDCCRLEMLPSGMRDLVNLRHLDIEKTCLEEMPKGMDKLKHLQFLSDYIVGKRAENGIRELGALADLHGSLHIGGLENVINSGEALEARMIDKKHINSLCLTWSSHGNLGDSRIERDILNMLRPHNDLESLSITGYRGTIFPDWLGHSSYHNMTDVYLDSCRNCCMLPSLGQLPSLKCLYICCLDGLESIGVEFYKTDESCCCETPFPSLEVLYFYDMSCWQKWLSFEFDAFPRLKELTMRKCPMLSGDLPNQLPALERLTIRECERLAYSLPGAPNILELSIEGPQQVESVFEAISHNRLTRLQSLYISRCSSPLSFPGACMPASLQELEIVSCLSLELPMQQQHKLLQSMTIFGSCDSLMFFPLESFPNLETLSLTSCRNLKCLVGSQSQDAALSSLRFLTIDDCPSFASFSTPGMATPQLEYLRITRCPEIDSFPEGGLPPNLRELYIVHCPKLVLCLASMDLHYHSLSHLEIQHPYDDSVKSFPMGGCLPASLESLYLRSFPCLETLDCKGLRHLQRLLIEYCPQMENFTGERLPASLTKLIFNGSSSLVEQCRMKDSQIWPKISHVRSIDVDGEWIFGDPRSLTGNQSS